MLEAIKHTSVYKSLKLDKGISHAYLFYSQDKDLNNQVALNFAKTLICSNKTACNECNACIQFNSSSHPDISIINQESIKVETINNIINKLNTMPISNEYKVFVILNAENINEIAQNKLLKSLEEPNPKNIFILTAVKTDKLLPTIISRLNKQFVPKLNNSDKKILDNELKLTNVNILKYLDTDLTLSEILNNETNNEFKNILKSIDFMLSNLKSSSDIPKVSSTLSTVNKSLFLTVLEDLFIDALNNGNKYEKTLTMLVNVYFTKKALINCLPLIENAYKQLNANVNFGYILDNLLFNILKEKFLCK